MYELWKTLHIASMFLAFLFFDAPTVAAFVAMRRRDGVLFARAAEVAKVSDRFGAVSVALGVGFGILTVLAGGISFLAPWLVVSYVILAIVIVLSVGALGPRMERAAAAVARDPASAEAQAAMRAPALRILLLLPPLLFLVIVTLMVTKPTF